MDRFNVIFNENMDIPEKDKYNIFILRNELSSNKEENIKKEALLDDITNVLKGMDLFNIFIVKKERPINEEGDRLNVIQDIIRNNNFEMFFVMEDTEKGLKNLQKMDSILDNLKWLRENTQKWSIFNCVDYLSNISKDYNIYGTENEEYKYIDIVEDKSLIGISHNIFEWILNLKKDNISKKLFDSLSFNFMSIIHNNSLIDDKKNETEISVPNYKGEFHIGVYTILIGQTKERIDKFIGQINKRFLPSVKKSIFIVTDQENYLSVNKNIYLLKEDKIGYPYEHLYKFKYFNNIFSNFSDKINEISHFYFVDASSELLSQLDFNIIPGYSKNMFTIHYNSKEMEKHRNNEKKNSILSKSGGKNNISKDDILRYKSMKNLKHVSSGFFGAELNNFMNMCIYLDMTVEEDESNKIIATKLDESHLNYYVENKLNGMCSYLGREYNYPNYTESIVKDQEKAKIIYNPGNLKKRNRSHVDDLDKIIINRYNKDLDRKSIMHKLFSSDYGFGSPLVILSTLICFWTLSYLIVA